MTEEQVREEEQQETNEASESAFREFLHHQRIAVEELGRAVESLFPKAFREHTAKAGKAFAESFRTLFEAAKDDLGEMFNKEKKGRDEEADNNGESATKIKVDIQ